MPEDNLLYLASSLTILDSFCYLNQQAEESFHLFTGVLVDSKAIIERVIPIKPTHQSMIGWIGDPIDVAKTLIGLADFEHLLLATAHIHPGYGEESTFHSSIDHTYQETLERGGFQCISCIFSRDGYLRFFSTTDRFAIRIYGKGVETINENTRLFKISTPLISSWPKNRFAGFPFSRTETNRDTRLRPEQAEPSEDHSHWRWWPWFADW